MRYAERFPLEHRASGSKNIDPTLILGETALTVRNKRRRTGDLLLLGHGTRRRWSRFDQTTRLLGFSIWRETATHPAVHRAF